MPERIYTRNDNKGLEPLEEEPFSSEDQLQALIANYPELLDGKQVRPDDPRRWLLITREKGIADQPDASDRWAVDHLIVDQDAVPTLVEVKRSANPQLRRNVVGQMLEYAAHAATTWTVHELRQTFESAGEALGFDPNAQISKLLQTDSEPDVDAFWDAVATNLAARRLRLLFVADEIPDPLERVVEFLNAQMPHIEVLAVEIKQFRGKSFQTLVPRVIGRSAAASSPGSSSTTRRHKLTRSSFLEELPNDEARRVTENLLAVAEAAGATLYWGSTGFSIRMRSRAFRYPISVAWLYPPGVTGWNGLTDISFGTALFGYDPPPEENLRTFLEAWVDEFRGHDFANPTPIDAWTVSYDAAAKHIDLLTDRLQKVLCDLKKM